MGFMKPSRKPAAIAQEKADIVQNEIKTDEYDRQNRVKAGRQGIDSSFDSTFSPDFYNDYIKKYEDNYFPQLDDKFAKSKRDLMYALAGQGIDESTAGINKMAEADKDYTDKKLAITGEAVDAKNKLATSVDQQRNASYALNESAADPAAATSRATAEATNLAAAPQYSLLGDVFAALLDGVGAVGKGMQSNVKSPLYTGKWTTASAPSTTGSMTTRPS